MIEKQNSIIDTYIEITRLLIQKNKIERALELLNQFANGISTKLDTEISLLTSNFKRAENRLIIDQDFDQFDKSINKLSFLLLKSIDGIHKEIEISNIINRTNPQTLLVPNNKTLEQLVGKNISSKISWLKQALKVVANIGRVSIQTHNSTKKYGNGFIIKGDYLLTTNHIIPNIEIAQKAIVEFNYNQNIQGKQNLKYTYELDSSDFNASPEDKLNYTKVKIKNNPEIPLSRLGNLKLSANQPNLGDTIIIIQHSEEETTQFALANSIISKIDGSFIEYSVNTKYGLVGYPIFNKNLEVIAIQNTSKTPFTNSGILITDILKDIIS